MIAAKPMENRSETASTPNPDEKRVGADLPVGSKTLQGTRTVNESVSTPLAQQKTSNTTPGSHGTAVETPTGTSPVNLSVIRLPVTPESNVDGLPNGLENTETPRSHVEVEASMFKSNESSDGGNLTVPTLTSPDTATPRKMLMSQMKNAIPSPESIATDSPQEKPELPTDTPVSSPSPAAFEATSFSSPLAPTTMSLDQTSTPSADSLKPTKLQFNDSISEKTEEVNNQIPKTSHSELELASSYPLVPADSFASVPFDCIGVTPRPQDTDFPDDEEPLVPRYQSTPQKTVVRTLFGWIETKDAKPIQPRVLGEDDVDIEEEQVLVQSKPSSTIHNSIAVLGDALESFTKELGISTTDSSRSQGEDEENPPRIPYAQASIARALQQKRSQEGSRRRLWKVRCLTSAICVTVAAICVLVFMIFNRESVTIYTEGPVNEAVASPPDNDSEPPQTSEDVVEPFPDGFFSTKNEYCTGAHQVYDLGVPLQGSTHSHVFDTTIDTCGDSMAIGRGAWFLFIPEESKMMEASTCSGTNFDTQLTIATGQHCDNLACVTFDDQGCGDQSRALWFAEAGEKYFISVHGFRDAQGDFELVLREVEAQDRCNMAVDPLEVGSSVSRTTAGSSPIEMIGQCGDVALTNQTGVWFPIEQAEGWIRADAVARKIGFATQLAVFRGQSCASLVCEAGSSTGSINWRASSSESYFVFVSGSTMDSATFDLSVSLDLQDSCESAVALVPGGSPFSGSTEQARLHDTPVCGESGYHSAPGKWFSVQGNGSLLAATTCASSFDLDTHISVFRNGCSRLQCVGSTGVDLPCGATGAVSWISEVGVEYLLYVSGRGSRVGDFSLRIIESDSSVGLECETAISTSPAQKSIKGSTINSPETTTVCGEVEATKGTWYSFESTSGSSMTLWPCNTETNFDVRLSLLAGSCGELECVETMQFSCDDLLGMPLKLDASAGVPYFLFVHGSSVEESGNFDVTVAEWKDNRVCQSASSLEVSSSTLFGSTAASMDGPDLDCDGRPVRSNSAWYTVVGNGDELFLSTCSERTAVATRVSVYRGDCESLVCVDVSNELCGEQERVSVETEDGEVYFVRVTSDESGDFVLQSSVSESFFGW